MNRETLTDEERRRRRNEASRRCYLKRKAMLEGAAPKAAKNKSGKPARKVEARPAKPAKALRPAKAPDALKLAEKAVKKFGRVAAGVKPMLREAVDALSAAYKSGDEKLAARVERVLARGLGVEIESPAAVDQAKSRVGLVAWSKAFKTPAFRQPASTGALPAPAEPGEGEDAEKQVEVPVDPDLIAKVEAGEAGKDDIPMPGDEDKDEEDEDEDEEDEDEDEEDEEDDSEEARARRREREERRLDDDWAAGRQEMMNELGAQGAFDD